MNERQPSHIDTLLVRGAAGLGHVREGWGKLKDRLTGGLSPVTLVSSTYPAFPETPAELAEKDLGVAQLEKFASVLGIGTRAAEWELRVESDRVFPPKLTLVPMYQHAPGIMDAVSLKLYPAEQHTRTRDFVKAMRNGQVLLSFPEVIYDAMFPGSGLPGDVYVHFLSETISNVDAAVETRGV